MLAAVRVMAEQVCAQYDTGPDCVQSDDEFTFTDFMKAWAHAAYFPRSFSPASRSALIEPLSNRAMWTEGFEMSHPKRMRSALRQSSAEDLYKHVAPVLIDWLTSIAHDGGLMTASSSGS